MPKEDAETRRTRLKNLIKLGKERGSSRTRRSTTTCPTTCRRRADRAIISTFGDMGIQVYDQAPDQETLLIASDATPSPQTDEAWRSRPRPRSPRGFGVRPHHRPGAHVHARDGLGRAAQRARARSRSPSASRKASPHDPGDQRVPDHVREILELADKVEKDESPRRRGGRRLIDPHAKDDSSEEGRVARGRGAQIEEEEGESEEDEAPPSPEPAEAAARGAR